jgi:hypothetical protein
MNYRIEIHPVKFRLSGRTLHTIHVYYKGEFLGMWNQSTAAARKLAAKGVPMAEALAAINRARDAVTDKMAPEVGA